MNSPKFIFGILHRLPHSIDIRHLRLVIGPELGTPGSSGAYVFAMLNATSLVAGSRYSLSDTQEGPRIVVLGYRSSRDDVRGACLEEVVTSHPVGCSLRIPEVLTPE